MALSQRVKSYLLAADKALKSFDFALSEGLERQAEHSAQKKEDVYALNLQKLRRFSKQGKKVTDKNAIFSDQDFLKSAWGLEAMFILAKEISKADETKALEIYDEALLLHNHPKSAMADSIRISKASLLIKQGKKSQGLEILETVKKRAATLNNKRTLQTLDSLILQYSAPKIFLENSEENLLSSPVNEELLQQTLDQLHNLVGLFEAKEAIKNLTALMKIRMQRIEFGLKTTPLSHHMVFIGSPGTGKTTVARLFGKILFALGILETDKLVEVSRAELVAGFVGQTAEQTDNVIDKALNGVLFIDEAYSLTSSENGGDFGNEAINQLLKRMEDDRNRLVVVFAGYKEQMEDFLSSNPGLKSRIGETVVFSDYSQDDLKNIFEKMCKENDYKLSQKAAAALLNGCIALKENAGENFGNARTIRNCFEDALIAQARRLSDLKATNKETLCLLEEADVKTAFENNKSG